MSLDFKSTLNIIKSKVTFNQVLESYGIKTSSSKMLLCPLHTEDTGSFKIYNGDSGDGSFWCFGCLKGGDMLSFVEHREGVSKSQALHMLATKFKIDVQTREYSNNLLGAVEAMLSSKETKKPEDFKFINAAAVCNQIFLSIQQNKEITPYMQRKRIPHIGTASRGSDLVVPISDFSGNIWSLQYIHSDGSKTFHEGSSRKGCTHRLGPVPSGESLVYLAEGYATGASVYLASGATTYVCFTVGNIVLVYNELKSLFPDARIVVAGDNDKAGRAHSLISVYPENDGQDWNDVWVELGEAAVRDGLSYNRFSVGDHGLMNKVKNKLGSNRR